MMLHQQCLLVLLSVASIVANAILAAHIHAGNADASGKTFSLACTKISPEIVSELKDFLDLIPTATVDAIVAEHYLVDGNFRKALKYLRSTQFTKQLQQLEEIPEIIEILSFLHMNDAQMGEQQKRNVCELQQLEMVSTPTASASMPRVEIVLLDLAALEGNVLSSALPSSVSLAASPALKRSFTYNLGTFTTFVEELMEHLPRDRYVQMINEKRKKSTAFAAFYAALRSEQLRPMVGAAMKSTNVASVIEILNENDVDVSSLEPIAFKVIAWGPPI